MPRYDCITKYEMVLTYIKQFKTLLAKNSSCREDVEYKWGDEVEKPKEVDKRREWVVYNRHNSPLNIINKWLNVITSAERRSAISASSGLARSASWKTLFTCVVLASIKHSILPAIRYPPPMASSHISSTCSGTICESLHSLTNRISTLNPFVII